LDNPPSGNRTIYCALASQLRSSLAQVQEIQMSPVIPGFQIIREIGPGSLATVYLALQEETGREVALKVFAPQFAINDQFNDSFLRMVRAAASIQQPSIVTIYHAGKAGVHRYLAMEYLAGGNLRERICQGMTATEAVQVAHAIAQALASLHANEQVHADIKPENILFRADGSVVVTDFGASWVIDEARHSDASGSVLDSSAPYLSPEQAMARVPDERSDIYSLGAVLFEMLTGQHLHAGSTSLFAVIKNASRPVPTLPDSLALLQPVLNKMVAQHPDNRFAHMTGVVQALQPLLQRMPNQRAAPVAKVTVEKVPVVKPEPQLNQEPGYGGRDQTGRGLDRNPSMAVAEEDWPKPMRRVTAPLDDVVLDDDAPTVAMRVAPKYDDEDDHELALTRKMIDEILHEQPSRVAVAPSAVSLPRAGHGSSDSGATRATGKEQPNNDALKKPVVAFALVLLAVGIFLLVILHDGSMPLDQGRGLPAALSRPNAVAAPSSIQTVQPVSAVPQSLQPAPQAEAAPASAAQSPNAPALDSALAPASLAEVSGQSAADQAPVTEPAVVVPMAVEDSGEIVASSESTANVEHGESADNSANATSSGNEVETLLQRANEALYNNQLLSPPDDNAVDLYQQVLAIDPQHKDARAGLEQIVTRYLAMASKQLNDGDVESARRDVARAGQVANLEGMPAEYQTHVTNLQNIITRVSDLEVITKLENWVQVVAQQTELTAAQMEQAYAAYMDALQRNGADPRLQQLSPAYADVFRRAGDQFMERDNLVQAREMISNGLRIDPANSSLKDLERRWILANDARLWIKDGPDSATGEPVQ